MTSLFRSIVGAAWRRRFLILIPFVLLTLASVTASILLPKNYESTALILLQEQGPQELSGGQAQASDLKIRARVAALDVLVRSDRVLGEVVQRMYGVDAETSPQAADFALEQLRQRLTIQIHDVYFVEISLSGSQPEALRVELNAIVERLFELLLLPSNATLSATDFLIAQQNETIAALEARLETLSAEAGDLSLAALGQKVETRDRAAAAMGQARSDADRAAADLREAMGAVLGDGVAARSVDEAVAALRQEAESASTARAEQIEAQIAALAELRPIEARALEAEQTLTTAAARVTAAEEALTAHRAQSTARAEIETELAAARAEVERLRTRFRAQREQTLRILEAPDQLKLVDEPQTPNVPTNSALKIIFAGVAGGLGLGLGLAVIAEQLDQSVRGEDDLNNATDLPVLARLPGLHKIEKEALARYGVDPRAAPPADPPARAEKGDDSPTFSSEQKSAVG